MWIQVEVADGVKIPLEVDPTAPISIVKSMLREKEIPIDSLTEDCRLTYGPLVLQEERTFRDYAIPPDATIILESTRNKFNYKAFRAASFEELDTAIEHWLKLVNKRVLTISCGFDGRMYFAMLATNPTEVVITDRSGHGHVDTYAGLLKVRLQ